MKALILAAGKGTRMGALTLSTPKPMLPLAGEPLLAHTVRSLVAQGITEIAINLHHAADVIRGYFGEGSGEGLGERLDEGKMSDDTPGKGEAFGAAITYSFEPVLLGTAGAARKLQSFLDERFVVVYGDVYSNVDLAALERFHTSRPAAALVTLALYRVPNPWECGLVDLDESGRVLRFVEKPPREQVFTDLANAGVQIVEPALLGRIPPGIEQDFGRDVLPGLLRDGLPIYANAIGPDEFVIDIGTPDGYARAEALAQRAATRQTAQAY